jgi:hypothetical protein
LIGERGNDSVNGGDETDACDAEIEVYCELDPSTIGSLGAWSPNSAIERLGWNRITDQTKSNSPSRAEAQAALQAVYRPLEVRKQTGVSGNARGSSFPD